MMKSTISWYYSWLLNNEPQKALNEIAAGALSVVPVFENVAEAFIDIGLLAADITDQLKSEGVIWSDLID